MALGSVRHYHRDMPTAVLEVRHFEMLAAIADTGSVARAADVLHLSQPAVSHALRALEDRLGVRLFERARRMALTPAGREADDTGRRVLALVRDAERGLAHHRLGRGGVVRVATECYTCYHWLPPVFRALKQTSPEVSVQIVGDATSRAMTALLNGELDVAVLHFKPADRRLLVEKLFTDEQVLVMSAEHPLARRKYVLPGDLATEHLFAHRPPERTAFWATFLEPAGVRPRHATALQSTEAIIESVRAGLGVAVMARWAVAGALRNGGLAAVRVGRHGLRRSWYAAAWKSRVTPAVTSLLAALKSDAGRHTRAGRTTAPRRPRPRAAR
jgi:LysR family transcriptional regulator for metE and metH